MAKKRKKSATRAQVYLSTARRGVGVFAKIVHRGQILLIRQKRRRLWCLPGGKLNKGETLIEGVHREVMEETSLRILIEKNKISVISAESKRYLVFMFTARPSPKNTPMVLNPNEISEARYFTAGQLPMLTRRTKLLLNHPAGCYFNI